MLLIKLIHSTHSNNNNKHFVVQSYFSMNCFDSWVYKESYIPEDWTFKIFLGIVFSLLASISLYLTKIKMKT